MIILYNWFGAPRSTLPAKEHGDGADAFVEGKADVGTYDHKVKVDSEEVGTTNCA